MVKSAPLGRPLFLIFGGNLIIDATLSETDKNYGVIVQFVILN